MNPGSRVAMVDRGTPALAERVRAILRDEIAGALANIAAASQVWSAHRRNITPGWPAG
jgi:hypothetical protein